jgi:uncharacterized protein (TIGR03032 family)
MTRSFEKPMGLALKDDRLVVSTKGEIIHFKGSQELAMAYPKKPQVYDMMYVPVTTKHTGNLDIHDIAFVDDKLHAVITSFSCIAEINDEHHFTPIWRPSFITELSSDDRCHLNGMVVDNNEIKYVTALGESNKRLGWRENPLKGGILIDYSSKEIIARNLPIPHSPRIYNNKLYLLLSATSELITLDPSNGKTETVYQGSGFFRGMVEYEGYIFIGVSKLRKTSTSFSELAKSNNVKKAGIIVIHAETGALCGEIKYESSVDEIYEVQVLPDIIRPNIINTRDDIHKMALALPNSTFWAET